MACATIEARRGGFEALGVANGWAFWGGSVEEETQLLRQILLRNATQINTLSFEEAQRVLDSSEMRAYAASWDKLLSRLGELKPYLYPTGDIQSLLHQMNIAVLIEQVLVNRS